MEKEESSHSVDVRALSPESWTARSADWLKFASLEGSSAEANLVSVSVLFLLQHLAPSLPFMIAIWSHFIQGSELERDRLCLITEL